VDRLFEDFFEGVPAALPFGRRPFPTLNIWEDDTKLHVEAELPGLKLDDLELYVDGTELTIKGQRQKSLEEGATFHRRERGVGPFTRVIQLPVEVDAEKVQATLRDGILTLTLPKAQAVLPRRIEVKGD
jgi:HSP20 family protein